MKTLWQFLVRFFEFLRKNRDGPEWSVTNGYCVHCGRPYTRRARLDEAEEVEEFDRLLPDKSGMKHVKCFPKTGRVEISRKSAGGRGAEIYLYFCEVCFLMVPRLAYIRFGRGCSVHYVWQNPDGDFYKVYEFGRQIAEGGR